MTVEQLHALGIDGKWDIPLNQVFVKYDINTPKRQAAFIGQCAVESANFTRLQENLNYSAQRLTQVWPSRFPNVSWQNLTLTTQKSLPTLYMLDGWVISKTAMDGSSTVEV